MHAPGPWLPLLLALAGCVGSDDDPPLHTDSPHETDTHPVTGPEVVALPIAGCRAGDAWTTEPLPQPPGDEGMARDLIGGAVAVLDLDGDGLRDVLLAGPEGVTAVRTTQEGLVTEPDWLDGLALRDVTSLGVVDLDGDGGLEVLATRWRDGPVLLRSHGAPPLVDVTPASLASVVGPWMGSAFGDLDGDGDLDVFLAGYAELPEGPGTPTEVTEAGEPSALLVQEGGAFVDRSGELPDEVQQAFVFGGFFLDLDEDGRSELFTVHDYGWSRPSQLLWSRPEGLVRDGTAHGWSVPFAGMGAAVGDLDGDGRPDVVQSSFQESSLLVQDAFGVWWEEVRNRSMMPEPAPPPQQIFGWGTAFVDVERDGDLDVAMLFGHWDAWGGKEEQDDGLWIQGDDGRFDDRAPDLGLAHRGASRGLVATDLDGDGGIELVVRRLREGGAVHRAPCPEGSWLQVRLVQGGPNRDGVGARVQVTAGGRRLTAWVMAGTHALYGSSPPEVDLGLGDVARIERLEVRWPDGAVDVVEDLEVPARIEVRRR